MKILDTIYLIVMVSAVIVGLWRYQCLARSTRIVFLLVSCDLAAELIGLAYERRYHSNLPVFSIYSLIEFFIICFYFNKANAFLEKYNIGIAIGIAGIIAGTLNILWLQPLTVFNSYFLVFEGIVVMILALSSVLVLMLLPDQQPLHNSATFWFSVLLAFFWSSTLFSWGFYDYFLEVLKTSRIIDVVILSINIFFYLALSVLFFLTPKMVQHE